MKSPPLHSSISKIVVGRIPWLRALRFRIPLENRHPLSPNPSPIGVLPCQFLQQNPLQSPQPNPRPRASRLPPRLRSASLIDKSLLWSEALHEIVNFVESVEELPFACQIPHFGQRETASSSSPTFAELGCDPPSPHIPAWLPAFPNSIRPRDVRVEVCDDKVARGKGMEVSEKFRINVPSIIVEKGERVLPAERPRVRFRFGLGLGLEGMCARSGASRGGKRVCWRGSDEEERFDGDGCAQSVGSPSGPGR